VTVGVVGDICRALEARVLPFCDGIMTELLKDLSSKQLHRSVKPPIFSCFGDIALAIGDQFEKYLAYAVPMLQGAAELSAAQMGQGDEELLDYNNQLRGGIFEAYSGLLQGFKGTPKTELLVPYAEHIVVFIETVYKDNERWVFSADPVYGLCLRTLLQENDMRNGFHRRSVRDNEQSTSCLAPVSCEHRMC
jgi:importin subunit beta-1